MSQESANEQEFYKLIKSTVRDISMSIMKEPSEVKIVTDSVITMVNDFTEKIMTTRREMNDKDFKDMDNIVTEALLKISSKIEHFLPTEAFIKSIVLKIAFMSLKVIDLMNKEKEDEQNRGD
jgi:hypothetical protein